MNVRETFHIFRVSGGYEFRRETRRFSVSSCILFEDKSLRDLSGLRPDLEKSDLFTCLFSLRKMYEHGERVATTVIISVLIFGDKKGSLFCKCIK